MNQIEEGKSSSSSSDTIILSSDSQTARSHWPTEFQIPNFTYFVEMQFRSANQAFISNGILLSPGHKPKSDILENKCLPAYGVKKLRKAEEPFCTPYPAGQTEDSLKGERLLLLSEVKKRHNDKVVKEKNGLDPVTQEAESRQRQAHGHGIQDPMARIFHCGRGKCFLNIF
ncbi:unnamed protein product [Menidia menidia]|uniref:(Atlantic silverside) hypothetical protein n=1 Tax=Menidia menidia TaxID=238744 RepID=A0A8S4AHE1_9TELE|nr:unnamed protein product [Menidia menidia]